MTGERHGWLDNAKSSRPAAPRISRLGQARYPDTRLDVGVGALVEGRHVRCADHVKVDGLRQPVCIPPDADPEAIVAEARELAGIPVPTGTDAL